VAEHKVAEPAITFAAVDIVFGDRPQDALPLLEAGQSREAILEATGQILGVAGCTLTVPAGEICVLMGLSGSGKSTLLRAVNGLNPVTRGRVLVADGGRQVDVASCDRRTLRHLRTERIAMVFQQFALLPWRTVAENVGFGLELRGMGRGERARIVAEKLEMVNLAAWADKFAHELSGGMQQRVGLARAFATDADILLMDEPFSALDPLIRDRLQDELLALQARLKKTILFVSHDLDEALKLGNQIAIMEGGRIIQAGPPEAIVTRPATDYVRAFVANVNPLKVLTAGSVMRPAAGLPTSIATAHGALTLAEGAGGGLDVTLGGAPVEPRPLNPTAAAGGPGPGPTVWHCPATTPVQALVRTAAAGHAVFLVTSADEREVLGLVGEGDLFAALLR
jgi:glycine betaine/proline transport system ATP-binding protein